MNGFRKLAVYLKGYEKETVLAPLFKMAEAIFNLLVPVVIATMIDVGIAHKNHTVIFHQFILLIIFAAAGYAVAILAQYFAAKSSVGFATKIRQAMFDHIESLSYTALDRLGGDTLITRMTSDVNQVQEGLNMALRLLLRSPFIVFGSLIMAFTIDVKCALIFLVAIPLLFLVVGGLMAVTIPLYRKAQTALDKILGTTRENLTGVRVIRAFCREDDAVAKFDDENTALTKINDFTGRIAALMNPTTFLIVNIATIVLIWIGGIRVNIGGMQQGQVVALYNYMAQMIIELIKLSSLVVTINRALACCDRVASVMDTDPEMTWQPDTKQLPDTAQNTPVIAFDHVGLTYADAGAPALSDIDFALMHGQTLGIIGGTGSGKSSLVNMIGRFYDATAGAVRIDGRNVKDYDEKTLIGKIGMVLQKATLFEGTIRDNMRLRKADATDDDIWRALTTAQAKEIVEGKAGGLDFYLEKNGQNLSGGQKQRLTIARALVGDPEILIMDDSASALDFATDAALRQAVAKLKDHMTVVIVSQRAASIRGADVILVLDDGQIVGKGTHDDLMRDCAVYREIVISQIPEEANKDYGQDDGHDTKGGAGDEAR